MQIPKLSLSSITDMLFGEKPPSSSEISAMLQSIQKSSAPPAAASILPPDWKENLNDIKKETVMEVEKKITDFQNKIGEIEKNSREAKETSAETKAKIESIEKNMKKFLSLYELVTNQVNPFIETPVRRPSEERDERPPVPFVEDKPVIASTEGKKISDLVAAAQAEGGYSENGTEDLAKHLIDIKEINPDKKVGIQTENEPGLIDRKKLLGPFEKEPSLIESREIGIVGKGPGAGIKDAISPGKELGVAKDIHIEEIKPEDKKILFQLESINEMPVSKPETQTIETSEDLKAILPLKSIKNDLYSLVTALNWIKYLVEKAGGKGAIQILNAYTTLNWITPEINQILVKYINGMAGEIEVCGVDKKYVPTMDDHMNSLFFIAKLKGIKLEKEGFDRIVKKWNFVGGDINGG